MLGAHGGMHQKWHQAYEESTHVPFIFHNPTMFSGRQAIDTLTSHADVIPTMIGLAGLDPDRLRRRVAQTHDEAHPFVGRDLSGLLLGDGKPAKVNDPVYFMTDDEVSRGSEQVDFTRHMYPSVIQPNHLETVVARLPHGPWRPVGEMEVHPLLRHRPVLEQPAQRATTGSSASRGAATERGHRDADRR